MDYGYNLYKHHASAIHFNHTEYKLLVWHVPFWAESETITFLML